MGPSTWGPAEHWWHSHFKGNPQKKSEPVTFGSSQQTKKIKRWLLGFLNSIWYYTRNMQVVRPCTGLICCFSVSSRSLSEGILLDLEFLTCSEEPGVYGKGCLGRAHTFSSSAVLDLCTSETSWASKAQPCRHVWPQRIRHGWRLALRPVSCPWWTLLSQQSSAGWTWPKSFCPSPGRHLSYTANDKTKKTSKYKHSD